MKEENNFSIQGIEGNILYRYIDNNGRKGKIHFSRSPLTPLAFEQVDGKTYVILDNRHVVINSMEEMDSINNALNNYKKSFKMLQETPSKYIAENNPDLYIKVIDAISEALSVTRRNKNNALEVYSRLNFLVNKELRINAAVRRQKLTMALEAQKLKEKE